MPNTITIPIIADSNVLPSYATPDASAVDLLAAIDHDKIIYPGDIRLIPAGFKCAIPSGFELQIRPRSGLAFKDGITVVNSPGTIDADYRGPIGILLQNTHAEKPFTVEPGMRIAQAALCPVYKIQWLPVDELPETTRGQGGFGSSGV